MTDLDFARYVEVRLSTISELNNIKFFLADEVLPSFSDSTYLIGSWHKLNQESLKVFNYLESKITIQYLINISFRSQYKFLAYGLAKLITDQFQGKTFGNITFKQVVTATIYQYDDAMKARLPGLSPDRLFLPVMINAEYYTNK